MKSTVVCPHVHFSSLVSYDYAKLFFIISRYIQQAHQKVENQFWETLSRYLLAWEYAEDLDGFGIGQPLGNGKVNRPKTLIWPEDKRCCIWFGIGAMKRDEMYAIGIPLELDDNEPRAHTDDLSLL